MAVLLRCSTESLERPLFDQPSSFSFPSSPYPAPSPSSLERPSEAEGLGWCEELFAEASSLLVSSTSSRLPSPPPSRSLLSVPRTPFPSPAVSQEILRDGHADEEQEEGVDTLNAPMSFSDEELFELSSHLVPSLQADLAEYVEEDFYPDEYESDVDESWIDEDPYLDYEDECFYSRRSQLHQKKAGVKKRGRRKVISARAYKKVEGGELQPLLNIGNRYARKELHKRLQIPTRWQNSSTRFDVLSPNPIPYIPSTRHVAAASPTANTAPALQMSAFERDMQMAIQTSLQTAAPSLQNVSSQLSSLLHREITPEDYDLLLLLDDSVAKKTVDTKTLDSLQTVHASELSEDSPCPICLDTIVAGEELQKLPCGHLFHVECIVPWLSNHSQTCPMCNAVVAT